MDLDLSDLDIPPIPRGPMVELGVMPNGYTLFRQTNEAGGHTYWSDEIGGGVGVWDTCLVDVETLLSAISYDVKGSLDFHKVKPWKHVVSILDNICFGIAVIAMVKLLDYFFW